MKNQAVTLPVIEVKKPTFNTWFVKENTLFSWVMEFSVSNRQMCLMAHSSLAFSALVCASFVSALPALICLFWFIVSLYLCVKGGVR